jgi:hypothetical protein
MAVNMTGLLQLQLALPDIVFALEWCL